MGGPDIEEMKNITPQRIIKTYQKYKTARRTAEVLGITHPTVTKYLKKAGITTYEPGWVSWQELRAGKESFKHSKFAEWLRNNEGVKLPRNIKRISEITKLSKDTIKCYLHRRYNRARYHLIKLGDLKQYHIKLGALSKEGDNYTYELSSLTSYKTHLDKFSHKIRIIGIVEAREGFFVVNYEEIDFFEFLDKIKGMEGDKIGN